MTALRILYAINSMEGGGAASPLPAILSTLASAGAEVRLVALTRRNGKAIPPIEAAGFPVIVRNGGEKDHIAAYRWLCKQALDFKATHLWTSLSRATLLGQIAGARLKIPVTSWQHNAFLKPWNERLLRWNAGRSALWVADSAEVAELTAKRLNIPADRLITWPIFFADPNVPQAAPLRDGETIRLGSLGRLHTAKGYDVLIAALAQLEQNGFVAPRPWSIEIAGEGGLEAQLKARCEEASLADRVQFCGFTSDPKGFLASLHLYLQPSRREGFCIAAHEAMQAGLPVLATATGEMPHTILDGITGRVALPGDIATLAEALRDLLSQPDNLAPMGVAARDRVLTLFSQKRFQEIGEGIVRRMEALA